MKLKRTYKQLDYKIFTYKLNSENRKLLNVVIDCYEGIIEVSDDDLSMYKIYILGMHGHTLTYSTESNTKLEDEMIEYIIPRIVESCYVDVMVVNEKSQFKSRVYTQHYPGRCMEMIDVDNDLNKFNYNPYESEFYNAVKSNDEDNLHLSHFSDTRSLFFHYIQFPASLKLIIGSKRFPILINETITYDRQNNIDYESLSATIMFDSKSELKLISNLIRGQKDRIFEILYNILGLTKIY